MTMNNMEPTFLELHTKSFEYDGFWVNTYRETVLYNIETRYTNDVLKEWTITDILPNKNDFLIKWSKRYIPLTDEEVEEKYNR